MKDLKLLDSPLLVRDYETTGFNPIYDQVLTSSAKRYKYGKIDDQIYLSCRCESSRLPSPFALMVNGHSRNELEGGMPLKDLMDSDYKFNQKYPSDFILAYNSKFDFNFSFNGYFQNLSTSNWYSWKTENKLICGLEILKTIYAFKKKIKYINFPLDFFASPSFRLERVCEENDISYVAHNSSEDVSATYQLFELMKEECPEIVCEAMKCASKQYVKNIINNNSFFCTAVGSQDNLFGRILAPIAWSPQGNDLICCDIGAIDPKEIGDLSSWDAFLQVKEQKLDNWLVKVPINKGKVFFGEEVLSSCFNPSRCNLEQLRRRADSLRTNLKLKEVCSGVFNHFSDLYSNDLFDNSLEKSIFKNFAQINESNFISDFNNLPWPDRWQYIIDNGYLDDSNRILRMAKKLVLEFDHSLAPSQVQRDYSNYCNTRLFDFDNKKQTPWNTISSVVEEINILKRDRPSEIKRIKEIEDYFDSRLATKYV